MHLKDSGEPDNPLLSSAGVFNAGSIEQQAPVVPPRPQNRIIELDGLRAFAIWPVMLLHSGPRTGSLRWLGQIMKPGWVGVDLFFVLSGFLITTVLLNSSRIDYYRNFISRRALRILPLYYLVLFGVFITTWLGANPYSMGEFQKWPGVISLLFYAANIVMSNMNSMGSMPSLAPVWSLQIEEQFYLSYPLVVAACSIRTLRRILMAMAAVALILRSLAVLLIPQNVICTYVLTPMRMDAIALGGLVACAYKEDRIQEYKSYIIYCFWIGCMACGVLFLLVSTSWLNVLIRSVGFSVIDVTCASALALVLVQRGTRMTNWLTWRPFVYTGQIAYGLYLLHMHAADIGRGIAGHWVRFEEFGTIGFLISITSAYIAASLSWYCFEKRILTLKARFSA
jgi:peptidoglycan/LPS O-acetylase OafA/YrhL